MPELEEQGPSLPVYSVGNLFPAGDLFRGIYARGAVEANTHRAHLGSFRDDQACRCSLGIIGRGQRSGDIASCSTASGHRGHYHPVPEDQVPQFVGS